MAECSPMNPFQFSVKWFQFSLETAFSDGVWKKSILIHFCWNSRNICPCENRGKMQSHELSLPEKGQVRHL